MISSGATQDVLRKLGLSALDRASLLYIARNEGSSTGFIDGVRITVHHAGSGKFMVEIS